MEAAGHALATALGQAPRSVLVVGRYERGSELGAAAGALAAAAGWPLLADPLSGARRGDAAIAHYDALLRDERFARAHVPDAIVRAGDLPTSKPLRAWLAANADVPQIALDSESAWQDPDGVVSQRLQVDPAAALGGLAQLLARMPAADGRWLADWREADRAAAGAIAETLGDQLSEPGVATLLLRELPADATLLVASSMPVRDVETFAPARADAPRVLANRGANGIDGLVSTAFGVAAAADGPVVLLIGDVALAHDVGGLLATQRLGLTVTIVLLDNGGGGIFDFLAVSTQKDVYEEHVATPTGLDAESIASLYGCAYTAPATLDELRAGIAAAVGARRTTILHVRTDRAANVALHRRVWSAVSDALNRRAPEAAPRA
jgi:2-succinyl-5-enolpyruvyl-6-hydroxy-3-cyclohexene-1-carboxylate synthase